MWRLLAVWWHMQNLWHSEWRMAMTLLVFVVASMTILS
ncbi:hypothetical protein FBR6_0407 [Lactiplantibacillus plantarum]|nr:hypothetical protein JM48_2228 [Lactiplantibacillus plantarum]KZE02961.1 hypothetical protein FBR6_0407 [Lactiplantibacillus plantarum]KZU10229.1 hypothetical protein Nizo2263_0720 [Lactiplantibacillus plantarum]